MVHQDREASAQLPSVKRIQYYRQIRLSFARPDIVLLLIACVALPSIAQQCPRNSSSCRIEVYTTVRSPDIPYSLSQTNLSRHHVIPASRLVQFFNKSLSNSNSYNQCYEATKLFPVLSNSAGYALAYYKSSTTDSIKENTTQLLIALNNTSKYAQFLCNNTLGINNRVRRIINHMFVWTPFNLFEGPQNRSDDPGPNFEQLAVRIIRGELFNGLKKINEGMTTYLMSPTKKVFNEVVLGWLTLISKYTWHMTAYNSSQWVKEGNGKYHIKKLESEEENQNCSLRGKREINEGYNLDPYSFGAEKLLTDHGDEIFHVTIVRKAFDRARNGEGFTLLNYNSWKDWYAASDWNLEYFPPQRGIIKLGRGMAKGSWWWKPYGYKFKDGSFAVGITGDDVKYGNDNWKTLAGSDWGSGEKYAGQIFFDKNGRPVALVMSSEVAANLGTGCSFIYNNGKWEYESEDDWDTRRFADNTLSLDSHAPRFFIE